MKGTLVDKGRKIERGRVRESERKSGEGYSKRGRWT